MQRGKQPKWKKKASFSKAGSSERVFEAPARRESATSQSGNFGSVSRAQIAVGGAGAGGGLGLNAPGFGPKVQHEVPMGSTRSGSLKGLVIDDEVECLCELSTHMENSNETAFIRKHLNPNISATWTQAHL